MRIVYLGSPDFAVLPLQKLAEAGQEIAAVYSQPDRPRGKRGKELLPTPVKAAALALGIPVHTPERINDPAVLAELAAYAPDLIVVVAYGQLLKEGLLNIPRLGCINIHGSLLPAYRGAAPIQRAVIDGCRESGVTIMYLDKGMDSGDIILKKTVPLDADETYGTLHDKLQEAGAELLLETVSMLEQGSAPREAQDHDKATFAPKISREEELKLYRAYYNLEIEMEATMWGCDYIVAHWDEVHELYDGFRKLSTEFLKSLGATEEDLFEIFK